MALDNWHNFFMFTQKPFKLAQNLNENRFVIGNTQPAQSPFIHINCFLKDFCFVIIQTMTHFIVYTLSIFPFHEQFIKTNHYFYSFGYTRTLSQFDSHR